MNPSTTTEPNPTPTSEQTPGAPEVEAKHIDLRLRRAELEQELDALTKKSKSYGSELWRDGQRLLGSSWDYAKAFVDVKRGEATDWVTKRIGSDRGSAQA